MPNLLVNGDFQIWQRGESFTITGDEAFHYTADCWCVYASTGQTVTVKKTSDGLTFSGTSAIMQRMLPLKVGQKYIFLAKVDNDVKTLQITGGTYTENSFLKYNKTGSYEQLQIKSNGNTKVGNARLWKGTTVYSIIEEDYTTALMRCCDKHQIIKFHSWGQIPFTHDQQNAYLKIPLKFPFDVKGAMFNHNMKGLTVIEQSDVSIKNVSLQEDTGKNSMLELYVELTSGVINGKATGGEAFSTTDNHIIIEVSKEPL